MGAVEVGNADITASEFLLFRKLKCREKYRFLAVSSVSDGVFQLNSSATAQELQKPDVEALKDPLFQHTLSRFMTNKVVLSSNNTTMEKSCFPNFT